jgi:hypothetical protein
MEIVETVIAAAIFILWCGAAIAYGFRVGAGAKSSRSGFAAFLICGSLLAVSRSWVYWYLCHRMRTHTVSEGLRPLWWPLLPEAGFVGAIRLESPDLFLALMYTALIVGSFMWAFPLMLFSGRRKLP